VRTKNPTHLAPSKMQKLFGRINSLPRAKQAVIAEVVDAYVTQKLGDVQVFLDSSMGSSPVLTPYVYC
jgi:hypothetical protein